MKKIFIIALLSFCLLPENHAQEWVTYSSREGKFSASFPTTPTERVDTSKSYPSYITKLFVSRAKTDLFIIGWVDYEASYTFDAQQELEANRDNFINAIKGTLISTKNSEFNGYKCLEFAAEAGQMFWTSKVFLVGRRPYQLFAGSTTGKASENENKFYNSFLIKKEN